MTKWLYCRLLLGHRFINQCYGNTIVGHIASHLPHFFFFGGGRWRRLITYSFESFPVLSRRVVVMLLKKQSNKRLIFQLSQHNEKNWKRNVGFTQTHGEARLEGGRDWGRKIERAQPPFPAPPRCAIADTPGPPREATIKRSLSCFIPIVFIQMSRSSKIDLAKGDRKSTFSG